jgi:hypothetical protein
VGEPLPGSDTCHRYEAKYPPGYANLSLASRDRAIGAGAHGLRPLARLISAHGRTGIALPNLYGNWARELELVDRERRDAGGYERRINFGIDSRRVVLRSATGQPYQESR